MFGTLTPQEINSVLQNNLLGRIGCYDGQKPYILPVSYAFHNNTIYCYSHEGLKLSIMRKNPSVCFQVDQISNMANWRSVMCWGKYVEITKPEERREAIGYLSSRVLPMQSSETTHLFPHWPFPPDDLNELKGIVFKISIDSVTGRFEREKAVPEN